MTSPPTDVVSPVATPTSSPKRVDPARVALVKEFLIHFCENQEFLAQRRKVLRIRAGLRDEDRKLVPKFRFLIWEGRSISEREVESDFNFDFILQYMASFAHSLPRRKEVEAALSWASMHYKLNPWKRPEQHEDWASVEAGAVMSSGSYCMERFQRNMGARSGHDRMEQIKMVIRIKLEENDLLTPEGKRKASRGRGKSQEKQEKEQDTQIVQHEEQSQQSIDRQETVSHEAWLETLDTYPYFSSPFGSPVHSMQPLSPGTAQPLLRGCSTSDLGGKMEIPATQDLPEGYELVEEEVEEELQTEDEEVNVYQDNETVQILSDDECVLSPAKGLGDAPNDDNHVEVNTRGKNDVQEPEQDAVQEPSVSQDRKQPADAPHVPEEIPNTSCLDKLNTVAESDEAVADAKGQQEMQSDEETLKLRASKGTFKDRKPLVEDIPTIPKDLEDQVDKVTRECESQPDDEIAKGVLKAQLALRQMAKEKSAECDDPDKLFAEDDGENEPGSSKGRKGGKKGRGRGRGKGKGRSGASGKAGTESEPTPEEVCVDARMDEGLDRKDETEPEVGEKPPKCPKIEKAPQKAPEKVTKRRAPAKPLPASRESQPKKAKTGEEDQKNEDQKEEMTDKEPNPAEMAEGDPAGESVKPVKHVATKPRSQPSDEAMCKARVENFNTFKDMLEKIDPCLVKLPSDEAMSKQKSFTMQAPTDLPEGLKECATNIQLLLVQSRGVGAAFYVPGVTSSVLTQINEKNGFVLKANAQRGVSLAWKKYGGAEAAWGIAKMVACWSPPACATVV